MFSTIEPKPKKKVESKTVYFLTDGAIPAADFQFFFSAFFWQWKIVGEKLQNTVF